MFETELETAISLSREAAKIVLEYYALEIEAEEKLGIDNFYEPVTAADRAASRLIVDGLEKAFPGDAILSEEESDDPVIRLKRDRVWIIDPIDGTAGFIKKDGDFAIQIGLAEKGIPVAGVVYLPFHEALYYATKGVGAYMVLKDAEPERLAVSSKTKFSEMTMAYSRNHPSKGIMRILDSFGFANGIQRGSVGLKIGLIAESICDIYIHLSPRTKFWDTCAPQIILEEAGGRVTDIFGEPMSYDLADVQNYGGILASNGISHKKAVEQLRPVLNEIGRLKISSKAGSV
ncbi:MAG TPA: 3'(2'),5'-bisphosphate nucleotidase CysQ [Pyrinomonadaceae bacterium]|nr:3'(2'),5'-bisphosphate nucleotidase CysQ [Pyrinomonadaceae bacterium]